MSAEAAVSISGAERWRALASFIEWFLAEADDPSSEAAIDGHGVLAGIDEALSGATQGVESDG